MVQIDFFVMLNPEFLTVIDELFKYKNGDLLSSKSFESLLECLLGSWLRLFGPLRVITVDQDGTLAQVTIA